jgi:hypothetical protein
LQLERLNAKASRRSAPTTKTETCQTDCETNSKAASVDSTFLLCVCLICSTLSYDRRYHIMSASFRKISRLSLEIFQDLITRPPSNPTTTEASSNRRRPTATSHNDTVESDRDAHDNYSTDPSRLRQVICHRLQRVPIRYVTGGRRRYGRPARHQSLGSGNHNNNDNRDRDRDNRDFTTFTKVETVGELLMLSRYTLLLVLDPILTYGT